MTGIISYGTYVPRYRIKIADIAAPWKREEQEVVGGLGVQEKSVAAIDEDTVTLSVAAAYDALETVGLSTQKIEAILIGSESHPYAVKPSSSIVGEILGMHGNYFAADLEFACKAGTAGVRLIHGLVKAGEIAFGIAIGADTAQAKPGDILECTAGAAAAAFLLGNNDVIAEIVNAVSYTTDTPDFWRRDGQKYPSHGARFTGEPAYYAHVLSASKQLLEKTKTKPSDFTHAVFHMPNGKFPRNAAKKLGFTDEQIKAGFLVEKIGNPYTASSLMGLAAVLDIAKPGEKIFVCSYGSGAGSDALMFNVTKNIIAFQKKKKTKVLKQIEEKEYIDYMQLFQRQIVKNTV